MAELFSVDGLRESQKTIKNLAEQFGFNIDLVLPESGKELGILFLSFRPEVSKIIMVISGTHGVEGPAGYDLQLNLLENRVHEQLPKDVGLVLVVALNPWGWAKGRRTDKNNVDLNRNCWFMTPPDLSPFDPEINALVHPESCDEEWYAKLIDWLTDPEKCKHLRTQVFRGQYDNPQGIFYGGRERAWSLLKLKEYFRDDLATTCEHLAVLDIHTGIGEWGEITLISSAGPNDQKLVSRVKSWFGLGPVFPNLGQTKTINAVSSDPLTFLAKCLPGTQVTALACEIGTVPFEEGFPVFVAENRLYPHPTEKAFIVGYALNPSKPLFNLREVDRAFQSIFYAPNSEQGDGAEWSAACRAGFGPIFRTVVRGLSEEC